MAIEQANFLPIARQKRDNARAALSNNDLAFLQDDVLDESAILFHRMEHWQESEQP